MVKVLHCGMSSDFGGIESYLLKITSNVDKEKFKFDFLMTDEIVPEWEDLFLDLGCNFRHVTPRKRNILKNTREVRQLMIKEKYDVIHCHLNSLSYITPAVVGVQLGIPTIVHSRNAGNSSVSNISKLLHSFNYNRLNRLNCKKMAVSDYAGEWMFSKDSNFTVINNGLDTDKYKYSESIRTLIRKELNIDTRDKIIVNVGAFRKQKNHMFLLDIFKEVIDKDCHFKLLLVGDGNLKKEIVDKVKQLNIEKSVIFMGVRKDIPNILSAADYFLFPSFYEGFPNAVIEAQASGLPCFISDTITDEVVVTENCHKLSIKNSPTIWANKILSENLSDERYIFSDIIAEKGFSVEEEIKKLTKIYQNLIKSEAVK